MASGSTGEGGEPGMVPMVAYFYWRIIYAKTSAHVVWGWGGGKETVSKSGGGEHYSTVRPNTIGMAVGSTLGGAVVLFLATSAFFR